jgi:uncharacterized protein
MEIQKEYKKNFHNTLIVLMIVLSLYFSVKFLSEVKSYSMVSNTNVNTIAISGHGELEAIPDIANISFTISKEAKTVKEAQEQVAKVEKATLDFLKENKVSLKDIKTFNVSFYPKYTYQYEIGDLSLCPEYGCPPRSGKNVISSYEASESIKVKVRITDNVGEIMQGLGALGVSQMNGPDFAIDNEDSLKVKTRKKAIDDAKEKAQVLAKDLGVRLGRVVSFSESPNYYPMPMMMSARSEGLGVDNEVAPAQIPKGENTISSDVTVVYEIR